MKGKAIKFYLFFDSDYKLTNDIFQRYKTRGIYH